MKILPIFGINFKSIQFTGEPQDEFHRIFSQWNDPEYLEEFFELNQNDLNNWNMNIETAIGKTLQFAEEFERKFKLLEAKYSRGEVVAELNELFEPLHAQSENTSITQKKVKFNWLRIYALRLDKEVYIITGGAIKLTKAMQERKHTHKELRKLKSCLDNLLRLGIIDEDTLIEEVEF